MIWLKFWQLSKKASEINNETLKCMLFSAGVGNFSHPLIRVIIYGRGAVEKGGDLKFECKQLDGGGAKFQCAVIEGGHVLSASDFRNSTAPPAVNNDHSLSPFCHLTTRESFCCQLGEGLLNYLPWHCLCIGPGCGSPSTLSQTYVSYLRIRLLGMQTCG